ncbi:hypothetical protein IQ230_16740 [Gloeocapsopsis crepidinum LEGE 06123]|uniref:Uncharacterized protein n=1 Tax=Gloeocapsopsis crepidinum LEGE 06123 TaxID=588587 RepID=A0ABR9UUJ1_9CHRO|nr:hypothetical protein [Gloeocapsopsis crepidinum]MBE9191970.1 hypothetical protein [Gloeocapsopsis crepidinum LEGE 06123]
MNYQQWLNYKEQELLVPRSKPASNSKQIQLSGLFNRVRCYFSQLFAFSDEPQVQEIVVDGKMQWKVYDPQSDRTLQLNSSQEVSMWLEERYYNRPINVWE